MYWEKLSERTSDELKNQKSVHYGMIAGMLFILLSSIAVAFWTVNFLPVTISLFLVVFILL